MKTRFKKLLEDPYYKEKFEICKFFGIKNGWKVLDVGCGEGGTSLICSYLVGNKGKVIGIDNDQVLLERAKKIFKKLKTSNVRLIFKDAKKVKFTSNFDIVIFLYSPQYMEKKTIMNLLRKARTWTSLVGIADQYPHAKSIKEKYYLSYKKLDQDLEFINGGIWRKIYKKQELVDILIKCGWKIIKQKRIPSDVVIPKKEMNKAIKRLKEWNRKVKDRKERKKFETEIKVLENAIKKNILPKFTDWYCILLTKK